MNVIPAQGLPRYDLGAGIQAFVPFAKIKTPSSPRRAWAGIQKISDRMPEDAHTLA